MLERLHEHINLELGTNTRTDTIYVVTAVIFNFVMLGVNSAVAGSKGTTANVVLVITIVLSVLVNSIAVAGLLTGRQTRQKLLQGLLKMYQDHGVSQYYDSSLLSNYNRRYLMFSIVIAVLGIATIAVPLAILITKPAS